MKLQIPTIHLDTLVVTHCAKRQPKRVIFYTAELAICTMALG